MGKTKACWVVVFILSIFFFRIDAKAQGNDWENPAVFQINRLPARATFMYYPEKNAAIQDNYELSPYYLSLNGQWKFN